MSATGLIDRDCWNSIGVQGDGSCPELQEFIHCRNCPVYRDAAAHLLDRELSAEDVAEATRRIAAPPAATDHGTRSIVIFRLANEWFSLPTTRFQEIAEDRVLHTVPHRRGGVIIGIVNVRGELLPCVALSILLGVSADASAPPQRTGQNGRVLILQDERGSVAFVTSEVAGVHRFYPEELRPAPATVSKGSVSYTAAVLPWNGTTVGCLDDELLLYSVRKGAS
jgi:chemotaxis-related protein WspD